MIIEQILICDSWDKSALVSSSFAFVPRQNAALIHSQNPERCATTISDAEGARERD